MFVLIVDNLIRGENLAVSCSVLHGVCGRVVKAPASGIVTHLFLRGNVCSLSAPKMRGTRLAAEQTGSSDIKSVAIGDKMWYYPEYAGLLKLTGASSNLAASKTPLYDSINIRIYFFFFSTAQHYHSGITA